MNQKIKSDAILILGGDEGRLEKGAALYKEGLAHRVILSPVSDSKDGLSVLNAVKLGIPLSAIIVENKSTSTFNTVDTINKIMIYNKFKSAIVVTSDYHMKRTMMVFDENNKYNFQFHFVTSLDKFGNRWYERTDRFDIWISEFKKMMGYRLHLYNFIDEK
ncbi:YdcF family protein [Macrococcus capreoli]|uniref:YdcF family protein n=1 Tax=Macrococcus capreoli TaxID=2982690 RepID=UPI0021D5CEA3|nr:YdcF family protein [Macrococcus sp. TMW 2.2395]MCU7557554.1 YdcF family protein [Macrococcus sp. TMW 2.2395]